MTDIWPALQRSHTSSRKDPQKDLFREYDNDDSETTPVDESTAEKGYMCAACDDGGCIETFGNEVICTMCGTIVDIPIEHGAEYRWFSNDNHNNGSGADPSRCSFPVNHLMPESSLGTMILSRGGGDGSGMMRRIKRYHLWNQMPYRESMLWKIFDGLQVRASNAGISTAVIEEAKELYAQLSASTICRGQTQRDALLAACIWESLNRHNSPRMPRDIATIFNITPQNVTKGIKQLQHLLALRTIGQETSTYATVTATDIQKKKETKEKQKKLTETTEEITARGTARQAILQQMATRTTTYEDFIVPFLTNLSIPRDVAPDLEDSVRRVCERIEDLGIVPENTPPSLTASVIAFCIADMKLPIEDTDIARVCGISVVTIQKCLKRLTPWRNKLLDE